MSEISTTRLEQLEQRISRSFEQAAEALSQIQREKLFAPEFQTFEEYCKERWGYSRPHGIRLAQAGEAIAILKEAGCSLPTREYPVRPLVTNDLTAEEMIEAWTAATEANPQPTNSQVKEAVRKVTQYKTLIPGSKAEVTSGLHQGQTVVIHKTDRQVAYASVGGKSYPFLPGELKVVEEAIAPPPPKTLSMRDRVQMLKDALRRVLDSAQELEDELREQCEELLK